ncbi:MAG: RagB/SusD family nutrient uptake outer membrane protein [Saprospiraceae bacterium]|nr:RagB/SusD family nutrient uptake outer membrane protein [Saprospiraceae bacterium]MBP7923802.1 RagB/SusD family nutrient uptake outer membrane protein [Saprospiraceae bacterium]MBP9746984.1 RagB/SusD family nutrient uptake outer membrane protein [Saprospiraceae bacterium]
MKNIITINKSIFIVFFLSALVQTGCKKDFIDPNRATEEQVLSSSKGLTGIAVGLQRVYTLGRGSNLYNLVTINGLLTNELFVVNTGNTGEVQLQTGGTAVDGNHTMLTTFWTNNNKVIYDANLVIENAKDLSDKSFASGLIAYASIFKALSIGNLSQFWEKVPAGIGSNISFVDRADGFKQAIAVLDEAQAAISANPISAAFTSSVPAGIDIPNTINALKARFYLYSNLMPQALASANLVDVTKKSTFNFDALSLNPLFEVATSTNNVVQPKDSTLGLVASLAPASNDARVSFYTSINPTILPRFRISGFGNAAATAFPIYLPGEINLIKAEAYTRQNDTINGKLWLNNVITKSSDPFNVFANQPAITNIGSQANLLEQIYRHRCIELFMSGQKLEDMRRFGRATSERKRNLMPYPLRERDNNPNTPADPAF